MKENRQQQIVKLITERDTLTMQQICSEFHISINTARSDVAHLVSSGVVEKIYGGIRLKKQESVPLYEKRTQQNAAIKAKLAEAAAAEIQDGDTVYIDAGTTLMHLLDFLPPDKKITVITASLPVIEQASRMPNIRLAVLPGFYDARTNALLDSSTIEALRRFQFTKAFIGTSSLTDTGSMGVSNFAEYEEKRAAISAAKTKYFVADASKYGKLGLLSFATLADNDVFITSADIPADLVKLCGDRGVQLVRVP